MNAILGWVLLVGVATWLGCKLAQLRDRFEQQD